MKLCKRESSISEGVELNRMSLRQLNQYLIDNGIVAILIGGKAAVLASGGEEGQIAQRKDTDLILVRGEESKLGELDVFSSSNAKGESRVLTNKYGGKLTYYVHWLGADLEAGLYCLPPEVIQLLELELSYRRKLNRVFEPGVQHVNDLSVLPREQIVLEFVGDRMWLDNVGLGLPITKKCQGDSLLISFSGGDDVAVEPQLALADARLAALAFDRSVEEIADQVRYQVLANYLEPDCALETVHAYEQSEPKLLDDERVVSALFNGFDGRGRHYELMDDNVYDLNFATACAFWLKIAVENRFKSLVRRTKMAKLNCVKIEDGTVKSFEMIIQSLIDFYRKLGPNFSDQVVGLEDVMRIYLESFGLTEDDFCLEFADLLPSMAEQWHDLSAKEKLTNYLEDSDWQPEMDEVQWQKLVGSFVYEYNVAANRTNDRFQAYNLFTDKLVLQILQTSKQRDWNVSIFVNILIEWSCRKQIFDLNKFFRSPDSDFRYRVGPGKRNRKERPQSDYKAVLADLVQAMIGWLGEGTDDLVDWLFMNSEVGELYSSNDD